MARLETIVAAIETRVADVTVEFGIGRLRLKENRGQRRVIFVRLESQIDPPANVGGKLVGSTRVRQVFTLRERVEIHIISESVDNTETLFGNVLAAARAVCHADFRPVSFGWVTEEPGRADYAVQGHKIVLMAIFSEAATDEIKALTTLGSQDHVGTFQGQSADEVIC